MAPDAERLAVLLSDQVPVVGHAGKEKLLVMLARDECRRLCFAGLPGVYDLRAVGEDRAAFSSITSLMSTMKLGSNSQLAM